MLRRTVLPSLLFFTAIFAQGCSGKACTLIGCASSLEVDFSGAKGMPGRYQIEVVADGAPSSCQITLPWTCATQPECSAAELPWRLTLSGCALGADQETLDGIFFSNQVPTSLEFVVRRDDAVVGGGSAQPVYKESRPNGPDCEPLCRQAPPIQTDIAP
jgi:hypothetical protein